MISDTLYRGGIQRKAVSECPELTNESFQMCRGKSELNHRVLRLCPPGTGGALFDGVGVFPASLECPKCLLL